MKFSLPCDDCLLGVTFIYFDFRDAFFKYVKSIKPPSSEIFSDINFMFILTSLVQYLQAYSQLRNGYFRDHTYECWTFTLD
jgi:hypothetical protein